MIFIIRCPKELSISALTPKAHKTIVNITSTGEILGMSIKIGTKQKGLPSPKFSILFKILVNVII
jgi:hypothetical protein